jgi:hypothetical protein
MDSVRGLKVIPASTSHSRRSPIKGLIYGVEKTQVIDASKLDVFLGRKSTRLCGTVKENGLCFRIGDLQNHVSAEMNGGLFTLSIVSNGDEKKIMRAGAGKGISFIVDIQVMKAIRLFVRDCDSCESVGNIDYVGFVGFRQDKWFSTAIVSVGHGTELFLA